MFESYTIQKILAHASTPGSAAGQLKAMGFTHILGDEMYIYGISSVFSEDEKTAFSRFEKDYLRGVSWHAAIIKIIRMRQETGLFVVNSLHSSSDYLYKRLSVVNNIKKHNPSTYFMQIRNGIVELHGVVSKSSSFD
jgi:hypothetical protein